MGLVKLCIYLSIFTTSVFAQRYPTRIFDEIDGLPTTAVSSITQDGDGYLWVVCRTGVGRFDGHRWRTYSTADGLPTMNFDHIRADHRGKIWAATNNTRQVLSRFENGRWMTVDARFPHQLYGKTFLFEIVRFGDQVVPAVALRNQGLWLFRNQAWEQIALSVEKIYSMVAYEESLYLATSEGPLVVTENTVHTDLADQLPEDKRVTVGIGPQHLADGSMRFWLVGSDWLGYLHSDRFHKAVDLPPAPVFAENRTMRVQPDGDNGVYFGNTTVFYFFHRQTSSLMPTSLKQGMASDGISDLLIDRENILWIAGPRGLTKVLNRYLHNYNAQDGLAEDEVSAVMEWGPGRLLIGHPRNLTLVEAGRAQVIPLSDMTTNLRQAQRIMDIRPGPDGSALIAASAAGLIQLNPDLSQKTLLNADGDLINSVYHDIPRGRIWVGSNRDLMYLDEDGRVHRVTPFEGSANVRRIEASPDNAIMVATAGRGLGVFNGRWSLVTGEPRLRNRIYCAYDNGVDGVLVGSVVGLLRVEGDRLVPAEDPAFKLKRPIYFLRDDGKGGIWAGTDNGVYHLTHGQKPRQYSAVHGLAGLETNRAAGLLDSKGNFWVGTDRGMTCIFPHERPSRAPPRIFLSEMEVNGRNLPLTHDMTLPVWNNNIGYQFQAVTMRNELGVQFQRRLEGYDEDWSEPYASEDRRERYTSLEPGSYRFHIRARLENGAWSEAALSPRVTIPKPLMERIWVRGFMALAAGGLLYLVFGYLNTRRMSKVLEGQVRERTASLEEKIEEHMASEARYQALSEQLEERVKERTAELESMQQDLMESAHYTGMAEIATSVLHNVGNILNSIITTGYLIDETLEKSTLTTLNKANHMLETHMDHLVEFLRDDPRGMQLMKLYLSAGKRLNREQDKLKDQMNLLMKRIQTIKDVVSQQHNYTSNIYQTEEVRLQNQVETALNILDEGMASHGVRVDLHCEEVPMVRVQKTKLIHTLVNILKNAREAVQETERRDGSIHVHLKQQGGEVVLSISDSGIGIAEEHLDKVFTHGFTTKEKGHGFGLHSCANAMKEMGGSIDVSSEGLGRGAVFNLRFPVKIELPVN
ncbi:MAG: ATP-binding protein [Acidobacteriota bacterium]|nr:ATP-binding protein [Acidobacteriota bacterium]